MVEKNEHSIVNFCIVFKEKHDKLKYMIWLMGINSHKFVYYNHTYCLNFVNYINKKQLKKMFDSFNSLQTWEYFIVFILAMKIKNKK